MVAFVGVFFLLVFRFIRFKLSRKASLSSHRNELLKIVWKFRLHGVDRPTEMLSALDCWHVPSTSSPFMAMICFCLFQVVFSKGGKAENY